MEYIYFDYWNEERTHRPYRNMVHSTSGEKICQVPREIFESLFEEAGVQDGDEFEIVIRKTGERPFGIMKVVQAVAYGSYVLTPEPESQMIKDAKAGFKFLENMRTLGKGLSELGEALGREGSTIDRGLAQFKKKMLKGDSE